MPFVWTQCYFSCILGGLNNYRFFYFRVEEKFAGEKFRGRKISREENFAGGKCHEIPFGVDIFSREKNFAKNQNSRI